MSDAIARLCEELGLRDLGKIRGGAVNELRKVRLANGAGTAVLRIGSGPRAVHDFLVARGYPAARVLAGGEWYLLVEHVAAPEATSHLVRPWRRKRAVQLLADLLVHLHALDTDGWPGAPVRTIEWWLEEVGSGDPHAVAWLEKNRRVAAFDDARICHFDFSPGNVLMRWGGEATVIDWDTAGLGDPICDLAFTVEKLAILPLAAPPGLGRIVRLALGPEESHLRAYAARRDVDLDRLRYWRALYCMVLQVWMQGASVAGTRVQRIAGTATGRRLDRAAATRFAELTTGS